MCALFPNLNNFQIALYNWLRHRYIRARVFILQCNTTHYIEMMCSINQIINETEVSKMRTMVSSRSVAVLRLTDVKQVNVLCLQQSFM
jgi:hypothetical protein